MDIIFTEVIPLFFAGTKKDEYLLFVNELNGKIEVIDANPIQKTVSENTVKLVRYARCKNENVHAALKQKYQILDAVLETTYLDVMKDSEVGKYTVLAAVCCGLYNEEHPGFPMRFLNENQKFSISKQILQNFNRENFLLHISYEDSNWRKVGIDDFHSQFKFPQLSKDSFDEIFEITTSVHALRKGQQVFSHMRKSEMDSYEIETFEEYTTLLKEPIEGMNVYYKKLNRPNKEYLELEAQGILPPWPGSGMLYRLNCLPSNKSDKVKKNWKLPTVFVLDNDSLNPLGFSNTFKSVGAIHCVNCPAASGGISGCCHIGFLFLVLSAPFALEYCSKPVKWVSIKNKEVFMHPTEAVLNQKTVWNLSSMKRISVEKRPNDAFYVKQFEADLEIENVNEGDRTEADSTGDHLQLNEDHDDIPVADNDLPSLANILEDDDVAHTARCSDPNPSNYIENDNLDRTPSVFSTVTSENTSTQSSLFGYGLANTESYLSKLVRRRPDLAVPESSHWKGKINCQSYKSGTC